MRALYTFLSKQPLLFLAFASLFTLSAAYLAEYGFGLKPCELCLYQRIPYALVPVLVLLTFFIRKAAFSRIILYLISLIFLASFCLAFYHIGVEKHWFESFTACGGKQEIPDTVEALREQLRAASVVRCDQPAFVFLGLSMAGWNALWSLCLMIFALLSARRQPTHSN